MSVSLTNERQILLTGACPSEDAELLLLLLLANPGAAVDWRQCTAAHSAVIQVLLASASPVRGPPSEARLARWIAPALGSA
jgi:hypothetical protein